LSRPIIFPSILLPTSFSLLIEHPLSIQGYRWYVRSCGLYFPMGPILCSRIHIGNG
jgi:hypothetical protein